MMILAARDKLAAILAQRLRPALRRSLVEPIALAMLCLLLVRPAAAQASVLPQSDAVASSSSASAPDDHRAIPAILPAQGTVQAAFTPADNIEALIVSAIDGAQGQILVQAYLLTNNRIIRALIAARRRGIDVKILIDAKKLEATGSRKPGLLVAAGIPVWLETAFENAHNKVIIIDAMLAAPTVITGSFNFTWTAQHKNAENILILRGHPALAGAYAKNWIRHQQQALPYR